jgi:hypothetical protein
VIWNKLDASLAKAVSDPHRSSAHKLLVFVGVSRPPAEHEVKSVDALRGARIKDRVFTAEVTVKDVERLSNASWVDHLSLSQATEPTVDSDLGSMAVVSEPDVVN